MSFKKKISDSIEAWRKSKFDDSLDVFTINECDLVNYKDPTFMIASGISCTFKCERECGERVCQTHPRLKEEVINYTISNAIWRYDRQSLSTSITFQGLEPLDNIIQLIWFLVEFRKNHNDKVIIWTGYTEDECEPFINLLKELNISNIIIKFGRYVPNKESHFDELLGVILSNPEQYSKEF